MQHDKDFQFDTDADSTKEPHKDALIRLGSQASLWHDADAETYATLHVQAHKENHRLRSRKFRAWLTRQFYLEIKKAPGSQATEDALRTLEAKAMFDGQERTPAVRLAAHGGAIYLDIGDVDWRAIEITPDGWQIVAEPPVPFIRPKGMRPLPLPQSGGSLDDVRVFFNCRSEEDFKLVVGYLVAAVRPDGDHFILVINGEQGSAKTTMAKGIRLLVDPNIAGTRTVPREERDLLIAARNSWIVSIDNLSEIRPWLSDALCRLATGGGFGARQLYTDGDEFLFEAKRPIIVNGIPDLATRPDLADRSIVLILPTINKKDRLPGSTFWTRFDERAPKILGFGINMMFGTAS
jgi:hypothetical protein